MRRTLGVVGVGLIGGSIALAAKRAGWWAIGYDTDPAALERARSLRVIDEACPRLELYERADVVAIAPHLYATVAEVRRLALEPRPAPGLIFDVGSVKSVVVDAARGISNFVATHPMAGTERRGSGAARPDLFDARNWAYVPSGDDALDLRAQAFFEELGARPVAVTARSHDRSVALTSHLPQLLASTFARRIQSFEVEDREQLDALCGPTARELMRLSNSNFAMWREVFACNAPALEVELRELARALTAAADALAAGDVQALAWP